MERMNPTPDSSSNPAQQTAADQERGTQPTGDGAPTTGDSALTTLTNYLIVSSLLVCGVVGILQIGLQFAPAWNAWYVPVLCFFIALECAYMTRFVRYGRLPAPWYVVRGVEVVVLFLIMRLLLEVLSGPRPTPDTGAAANRVDGEFLALVILSLLTWLGSWYITSDLLNLGMLDPALDREVIHEVAQAQVDSRKGLISFILLLGVALTFLAGLLRIHLRSTTQVEVPALYGLWHVVIYFFLALVLVSRTRLNLLRSGWQWEKVPIGHGVGARWITYTLLLLGAALIIALVLPTQYSLGLLGTLSYLLNVIIATLQTILYLIIAVILNLLSRLFPNLPPQPPPPEQPIPNLPAGAPPPTSAEFIQSLIFWGVFSIIAGYVVVQFLRQHPELATGLGQLPGMSRLGRLWHRIRAWFGGLHQQIEDLLEARRRARGPAPTQSASAPRRWLNPRRLSPRQQVQFYYLAMLRRGGEHGHARRPAQTPYEYARRLESQIPEINQDVDGITGEFIEARYSRHDIPPEHVGLVRRYWKRIKQALKR